MQNPATLKFVLPNHIDMVNFCGVHDSNLRCLERNVEVKILPNQDGSFFIKGESHMILNAKRILDQMIKLANKNITITHNDIILITESVFKQKTNEFSLSGSGLAVSGKTPKIKTRTLHQEEYLKKVFTHDMIFGIGPAGTGKTYLAVAAALHELYVGNTRRIILTRPIVETDEQLGFLPGTLEDKIDPYIRPLYDAIQDMIPPEEFEKLSKRGQIELAPLAYMRGRTLTDAFIILDEAQNATANQMHMFLTRLGENSKMVITGDITQVDLKQNSGLADAVKKLGDIPEIAIHYFDQADVVRHGLVKKIIEAYS